MFISCDLKSGLLTETAPVGRLQTRRWQRSVNTTCTFTAGLLTSVAAPVTAPDATPDLQFSDGRLGCLRSVTRGTGGNTHTYLDKDDDNGG